MKPAFDVSGRDVPRDFQRVVELLNRDSFRTRYMTTRIHDAVPRTYDAHYYSATFWKASTDPIYPRLGFSAWRECGRVNATAGTTVAVSTDVLVGIPFIVDAPFLIDAIQFNVTTAGGAGSVARIGIYSSMDDRNGLPYPYRLLADGGQVDTTATGVKTTQVTIQPDPARLYWAAYLCGTSAPTVRSLPLGAANVIVGSDPGMGTGSSLVAVTNTVTYGALPDVWPLTSTTSIASTTTPAIQYHQTDGATWSQTRYLNAHWPTERGAILRSARLVPSTDFRSDHNRGSIRVAAGIRDANAFAVLGTEWDSAKNSLLVGVPFPLFEGETEVPEDSGLVVRVTNQGWPTPSLDDACVEWAVGYERGA